MRYRCVFTVGVTLAFAAGTAFAGDDDPNNPGSGSANGSGSGSAVGGVTAAAGGGATPPAGGPIITDGLVLPKGDIGVIGGFEVTRFTATLQVMPPPAPPTTVTTTTEGLEIGGGYGITDQITAGLNYFLPLNDDGGAFPDAGALDLYGAYQLLHNDKMALAFGADFAFDFLPNTTDVAINLGATFRYNLTHMVSLYTGEPIMPNPVGQQLSIGLNSNAPITLSIPVGVGLQPMPELYAFAETTLAEFAFAPKTNADFIFGDFIPLNIGALYRIAKMIDLGGEIGFADLEHSPGNALTFAILARYRRSAH